VRLCGAGAFDDEVAAWERSLAGRIQGFVGGSFVEIDRYAIARPPLRRGRAGYSMGLILGARGVQTKPGHFLPVRNGG